MDTYVNALLRHFQGGWISWTATIALLVVTTLMVGEYDPDEPVRWLVLGLMVALMVIQRWQGETPLTVRQENVRMAVMTLIAVVIALLGAHPLGVIIIGFVLSAHAVFSLSDAMGFAWIGLYCVGVIFYLALITPDLRVAILNALGTCAGYFFMGAVASAQKRAVLASEESSRLLGELQAAHRKLQEYATHAEELAVERERNRLARDMHDTLGHRLTVAAVQLEAARKLTQRDPERAAAMLETVRQEVLDGLNELRQTVAMLRRPGDARLNLPAALAQLVTTFQAATGIVAELTAPNHLPDLDAEQQQAIYRASQEALTNVQRHAQAQHVWLHLVCLPDDSGQAVTGWVRMSVEDDGVGFPNNKAHTGYGLIGLAERAAELGGRLICENRAAGGAALIFEIPVIRPTEAASVH